MQRNGFTRNRLLEPVTTGISDTAFCSWIQGYTTLANGNTVKQLGAKQRLLNHSLPTANYEVI